MMRSLNYYCSCFIKEYESCHGWCNSLCRIRNILCHQCCNLESQNNIWKNSGKRSQPTVLGATIRSCETYQKILKKRRGWNDSKPQLTKTQLKWTPCAFSSGLPICLLSCWSHFARSELVNKRLVKGCRLVHKSKHRWIQLLIDFRNLLGVSKVKKKYVSYKDQETSKGQKRTGN